MSDNKKYYYLKLKDNFFDSDELIVLESMPDGYIYSNILLKLYLRSLKYEGRLMFNERIPFNSQMLANVTRHSVGDVEKAVQLFNELGLIEVMDNGAIYMMDIQNFIGESSTEADRIRAYRAKIAQEKKEVEMLHDSSYKCNNKCTPEIELEKELELELKKDILSGKAEQSIPFKEIVDYLNEKTRSRYKHTSKKTQSLIRARFNDGFTLDDFKKVIDIKTDEWKDTDMSKFLRPETLFGTKFESYLNQKQINKEPKEVDYQKAFEEYFAEQKKPTSASHSSWNV